MPPNRIFGLLVVVVSLACSRGDARAGPETRMVDAGGHLLEMVFQGEGEPAVVFDAGMVGGMGAWTPVRDSVSLHTQTVVFERAGFGRSEQGRSPRTAEQLSRELRTALANADVQFPIVLVGHSAGGMFAAVFAHLYPADVAGLVFVDAATVAVYDYMRHSDPERWANYVAEVTADYDPPPGWFGQWEALPTSLEQAADAWPLPAVPTVVLSALTAAGEWPIESDRDMEVWEQAQRELAERISGAEYVVFPDANHMSILREPRLREEVLSVWERAAGR